MKLWQLVAIWGLLATTSVESAKILGLFDFPGRSHFNMFEPLLKELAARGHEVTVLSSFPQTSPVANYKDISMADLLGDVLGSLSMDVIATWSSIGIMHFLWMGGIDVCSKVLEHPETQALIASDEKFDLIITELFSIDCFLGFAQKKQIPFISMTSSVVPTWGNDRFGNPFNPAYVPHHFSPFTGHMTFCERLQNTIRVIGIELASYILRDIPLQTLARKHFGEDLPPISEIAKNTSLILINSHFSLNQPRPFVPNMIEVAGLHVTPNKKLPKDIETFMSESPEGIVYFSMGSVVKGSFFSEVKIEALVGAFSQLKQRVLWKIDPKKLKVALPKNVMAMQWMPQSDILHHPKTRAFITHGGLMGTQEAVHAGVPMVGIPFFGDQRLNIEKYTGEGLAVKLEYDELTSQTLLKALKPLLEDPKYKQNAVRFSELFKDRPQAAMETAIFWTEYVIRHNGAHHLRSAAADLPLYQYLLLDVLGALLFAVLIFAFILYKMIKTVIRICCNYNVLRPATKKREKIN